MGKAGNRKNAGNSQSYSQLSVSLPSPPSTLLPPPLSPKNASARVRSFRKLFGYTKSQNLENQSNAVVLEDSPPVPITIPGQDDEDIKAMSIDKILRGMSFLRVFSIHSEEAQKAMQVSLDDHGHRTLVHPGC